MEKNHECFISRHGKNSPWILAFMVGDRYDESVVETAKMAKRSLGKEGRAEIRKDFLVLHGELGCCLFRVPSGCMDNVIRFVREFPSIRGHAPKSRLDIVGGKYVLVIKKG